LLSRGTANPGHGNHLDLLDSHFLTSEGIVGKVINVV